MLIKTITVEQQAFGIVPRPSKIKILQTEEIKISRLEVSNTYNEKIFSSLLERSSS
jgi:hypothetical protein